jgi:hypothetical protein
VLNLVVVEGNAESPPPIKVIDAKVDKTVITDSWEFVDTGFYEAVVERPIG